MKKLITYLMCVALLIINIASAETASPVFKSFSWGDPKEAVLEFEGEPCHVDEVAGKDIDYIVYDTKAVGYPVYLIYYFSSKNGLYQIQYKLQRTDNYLNPDEALAAYADFKTAYTEKYGTPEIDGPYELEISEELEDNKRDFIDLTKRLGYEYYEGLFISGFANYMTTYVTDTTVIELSCEHNGLSTEPAFTATYKNIAAQPIGDADYSDEI